MNIQPDFPGLNLTRDEKRSPLWLKVTDHWQKQVDILRIRNDQFNNTPEETLNIRAEIAVLKKVLAAGALPGQDEMASELVPGSENAVNSGGDWN